MLSEVFFIEQLCFWDDSIPNGKLLFFLADSFFAQTR